MQQTEGMDRGHRQALREAAATLVRRKGLARTTARDLVSESGANLRSIGYHFGSKDELMAEVLAGISAEWTAAPVQASAAPGVSRPQDRMLAAVRTMLTGMPGKLEDLRVYLEGLTEGRHSPALAAELVRIQHESLDAIAAAMIAATPALDPAIARLLARVLVAVHDGLALQRLVGAAEELDDTDAVVLALAGLGVTLAAGQELPGAEDAFQALVPAAEAAGVGEA